MIWSRKSYLQFSANFCLLVGLADMAGNAPLNREENRCEMDMYSNVRQTVISGTNRYEWQALPPHTYLSVQPPILGYISFPASWTSEISPVPSMWYEHDVSPGYVQEHWQFGAPAWRDPPATWSMSPKRSSGWKLVFGRQRWGYMQVQNKANYNLWGSMMYSHPHIHPCPKYFHQRRFEKTRNWHVWACWNPYSPAWPIGNDRRVANSLLFVCLFFGGKVMNG